MYRPQNPCKDCKKRGLDVCLECEEWKTYKAKMLECYESEHRAKSVDRAFYDYRDVKIEEKQRKKGYKNFFNR